jgi:hypothetical protein
MRDCCYCLSLGVEQNCIQTIALEGLQGDCRNMKSYSKVFIFRQKQIEAEVILVTFLQRDCTISFDY